jgi:hypothetical protein
MEHKKTLDPGQTLESHLSTLLHLFFFTVLTENNLTCFYPNFFTIGFLGHLVYFYMEQDLSLNEQDCACQKVFSMKFCDKNKIEILLLYYG